MEPLLVAVKGIQMAENWECWWENSKADLTVPYWAECLGSTWAASWDGTRVDWKAGLTAAPMVNEKAEKKADQWAVHWVHRRAEK